MLNNFDFIFMPYVSKFEQVFEVDIFDIHVSSVADAQLVCRFVLKFLCCIVTMTYVYE